MAEAEKQNPKDFRVAVKALIVSEDNALILKREPRNVQRPEMWEIPGGRLDAGENPFEGLKREVKEECGLDIALVAPLNVRHFTRADGQLVTQIVFLCRPGGGEVALSGEHTAYQWLDTNGDLAPLDPFYRPEIRMYNALKRGETAQKTLDTTNPVQPELR